MKSIVILLVGCILYQCATVAVTGRKQLSLVSNTDLLPMSFNQYSKVMQENELSGNKTQAEMVSNVGRKIRDAVEEYFADHGMSRQLEGYKWEFNLIEDDVVNAWCMPGGKVAFYTGIMPICKDEKGVAVVMGHEVAHAVANHGRERMSQGLVTNGFLSVAGGLSSNPTLTQQVLLQSAGVATNLGMLAFSRKHESEADELGLVFMAMAGYDPHEAPKFWERMASNSKGSPPEFLSTHPSHSTRIEDLKAKIPEAMKYYK